MRDFKGMKRQRGRNRPGGGGGKPGGGGNANRAFDSNGPENLKVRGSAQHIFEKYQQLARDAGAGDRVLLENYLQHAEHYYRLIRTLQPQRPPADIMGRETFTNGYDLDFEDETIEAQQAEANAAGEAAAANEDQALEAPRPEGQRQDGGFRDRDGRREERDRPYGRERDDRPREFRGEGQPREPRPDRGEFRGEPRAEGGGQTRADRNRDRFDRDRPRDVREGRFGERAEGRFGERPRDETRDPSTGDAEADAPNPLPDAAEEDGRMLRDEEGGTSPAPAFLQAAPEGEGRPRRRRRTRDLEEGGDDAPIAPEPPEEV